MLLKLLLKHRRLSYSRKPWKLMIPYSRRLSVQPFFMILMTVNFSNPKGVKMHKRRCKMLKWHKREFKISSWWLNWFLLQKMATQLMKGILPFIIYLAMLIAVKLLEFKVCIDHISSIKIEDLTVCLMRILPCLKLCRRYTNMLRAEIYNTWKLDIRGRLWIISSISLCTFVCQPIFKMFI